MFGQPQEEGVDNLSPTELQLTAGRFLVNSTKDGVRHQFEKVCGYFNNGAPKRAQTCLPSLETELCRSSFLRQPRRHVVDFYIAISSFHSFSLLEQLKVAFVGETPNTPK